MVRIASVREVGRWAMSLPPSPTIGMLLAGDRLSCCDEAAVWEEEDGKIIGAATIAPKGEQMSGEPTIVGIYVVPGRRREGIGRKLLIAAIERCRERGLVPVRVDILSTAARQTIAGLLAEYARALRVIDLGSPMDFFPD